MKTITLCGSTKFWRAFIEWNIRLSLEGNVVLSVFAPGVMGHGKHLLTPEQKKLADKIHFAKIDQSDEIFVLDVGGYVGPSTSREIAHAEHHPSRPISIRYLSQEYPDWTEEDCKYIPISLKDDMARCMNKLCEKDQQILEQRGEKYGPIEPMWKTVGNMRYLLRIYAAEHNQILPLSVLAALDEVILKMVRIVVNVTEEDHYVDARNYITIAEEVGRIWLKNNK